LIGRSADILILLRTGRDFVQHSPVHFERFLIRLQRQWARRRLLDGFVLGIAVGCVVAVVVFLVNWWFGYQALGPLSVVAMLAVAGGLGAGFGVGRRKSLAQIALMADRALGTHELFVSALFARSIVASAASDSEPTDPWAAAVIVQAQRRAAELTVRRLLLTIIPPAIATRIRLPVFLLAGAVVAAAASLPAGRGPFPAAQSESSTIIAPSASDAGDPTGPPLVRIVVAMPPAPAPVATTDDLASRMDATQNNSASPAQDALTSTKLAQPDQVQPDQVQFDMGGGADESRTANASTPPPPNSAIGSAEFDRARRPAVAGGSGDAAGPINPSRIGPFNSATAGPPSAVTSSVSRDAVRSPTPLIAKPFAPAADANSAPASTPDADRDLLRDYFSPDISANTSNAPNGLP
jgi:hypothetical protein